MIQRSEHCIMSNQRTIADIDSALILKLTSGIDKYTFSKMDVFSAVCIKRRK